MADTQVNLTSRDGLAAANAIAMSLDPLTRKQRILDHIAQSRRARQSSNFQEKSVAAQARIQRRLAAQRRESTVTQAQAIEAARLADADREARQAAANAQSALSGSKATGDPASAQEWLDSVAQLKTQHQGGSRFAAQGQEAAAEIPASRRNAISQVPIAPSTSPEQREIASLEARVKAERQRADIVATLLEDLLSSSTASLVKHQTRLEAMQAQINALQGR